MTAVLETCEWSGGNTGLLRLWNGNRVRPRNGDELSFYHIPYGILPVAVMREGKVVEPEVQSPREWTFDA